MTNAQQIERTATVTRRLQQAIAAGVRHRRETAGLTVEQAAARARRSRGWWRGVEDGHVTIGVDDLAGIARALGCDPAELAMSGGRNE